MLFQVHGDGHRAAARKRDRVGHQPFRSNLEAEVPPLRVRDGVGSGDRGNRLGVGVQAGAGGFVLWVQGGKADASHADS